MGVVIKKLDEDYGLIKMVVRCSENGETVVIPKHFLAPTKGDVTNKGTVIPTGTSVGGEKARGPTAAEKAQRHAITLQVIKECKNNNVNPDNNYIKNTVEMR